MNKLLTSKTVLISGASGGIGAACAEACAMHGANVALFARSVDKLSALAATLTEKYSVRAEAFELDIRKRDRVPEIVQRTLKTFNAIDILINNAGLARGLEKFHFSNIDDWEEMIDTNLKGLLYLTRAVLPGMVARNQGHIVNIGSIAGHRVYEGGSVYCATKHAVDAISRGLKRDLEKTKIRVSTVDPGAVQTQFSTVRFHGDQERAAAVYKDMEPLIARDIAEIVAFCVTRPAHVNLSEVIVLATEQHSLL